MLLYNYVDACNSNAMGELTTFAEQDLCGIAHVH